MKRSPLVPPLVRGILTLLVVVIAGAPYALGGDKRDVVFECPCHAEWVATGSSDSGELTVHFGVRNFRASESGEVRLSFATDLQVPRSVTAYVTWGEFGPVSWLPVGRIGPDTVLANQSRTFTLQRPESDDPILIWLYERTAQLPPEKEQVDQHRPWHRHEGLALWAIPEDASSERVRLVDILTDTDGDGVGDVNERLAGTSPEDAADTPGLSTIDVLAVFDTRVYASYDNDPFTRIHHLMTLTRARFADSGTNIRLRTVGMRQTEWNEGGLSDELDTLMEAHGADLVLQLHAELGPGTACPFVAAGCAPIGSAAYRGLWRPVWAAVDTVSGADVVAHELGHVLGLAHSARQGEASGAFRWSRGYYVLGAAGQSRPQGTIMTYGQHQEFGDRFSSSLRPCHGERCGVRVDAPDGADAVASLDLLRFQVAALREAMPDRDGDGFVDATDASPDDPRSWSDLDGDGLAEAADLDDDGDGVPDAEDSFPFDPAEWEDVDGDRIGDNADEEVADLAPFRDPALRAAVEAALDKRPGARITASDLAFLETLVARDRGIRDLTGLELATSLRLLDLRGNAISDTSPLSDLTGLRDLYLDLNDIDDPAPLTGLPTLNALGLSHNTLSDIAPLARLRSVRRLALDGNHISDLSPLASLGGLSTLTLSRNAVTDLSPLADLTQMVHLDVSENAVADLSPLSGMRLEVLRIGYTDVTLEDLRDLQFRENATLDLTGLGLDDVSALPEMVDPRRLILRDNSISNVRPLAALTGVKLLDLSANEVASIGALVKRDIWRGEHEIEDTRLRLDGNPLGRNAIDEHVPTLRAWGLKVQTDHFPDDEPPVAVPDPVLHALIGEILGRSAILVDHTITEGTISKLSTLRATGAGLSDLTGLEAAHNLQYLFAGSNALTDLGPLSDLPDLIGLDLSSNQIADIGPLVDNRDLDSGDWIALDDNPLSEESVNTHIPALLERGVAVSFEGVRLAAVARGDPVRFDVAGHFAAVLGDGLRMHTKVRDPALAHAEIVDGRLTVRPGASGGRASVTVTATDEDQRNATVTFSVTLRGGVAVTTFPPAADPIRQGFMRVINSTVASESLRIDAFDQRGTRRGPATLTVGPGEAAQFNSDDLEAGNPDKGLSDRIGPGDGDWRLAFLGSLDARVLSYIRTTDGFVTSMHELAPMTDTGYRVVFFNPGSNLGQVSLLRLINPRYERTEVTITGIDDTGVSPGGAVTVSLGPQAPLTLSARELETGDGLTGALGDGAGKWQLNVAADQPILVASLLRSPTGHLTNLSSVPDNKVSRGGETVHDVPLFLSASEAATRQGFARVINRGSEQATVRILARDDSGAQRDPITLTVAAGSVAHFNSIDLETGNLTKGLSGGIGAGQGHWRLELSSAGDLDVLAYIRTTDGFVTSMHDTVPLTGDRHHVPIFNPGSNRAQVSHLRLTNPGTDFAWVAITGVDDQGNRSGNVTTAVAPRRALTLSAQALESGEGLGGKLGDGAGKWRLTVTPHGRPVQVMSLLESPTGHLTNLSTGPD